MRAPTRGAEVDRAAFAVLMRSAEMHRMVQETAERIAEHVKAQNIGVGDVDGGAYEVPLPVEVEVTTTDRAHASVILAHPAGIAVQAKHGALSKGASSVGLEVHGS